AKCQSNRSGKPTFTARPIAILPDTHLWSFLYSVALYFLPWLSSPLRGLHDSVLLTLASWTQLPLTIQEIEPADPATLVQKEPATPVPAAEPATPVPAAEPATPVPAAEPATPVPAAEPATPVPAAEPAPQVPAAEPAPQVPAAEPAPQVPAAEPAPLAPPMEPAPQEYLKWTPPSVVPARDYSPPHPWVCIILL
uniref:Uncharacterized protein n=1 Tax=Leptobrachium leishanense TaxID=445787 RepID=A0A8C5M4Q0_9ANUR